VRRAAATDGLKLISGREKQRVLLSVRTNSGRHPMVSSVPSFH
jgi:hypothetical protein